MTAACYKKTVCLVRVLCGTCCTMVFEQYSFFFSVLYTFILPVLHFLSTPCFVYKMANEIQPATVGNGEGVEIEMAIRNVDDGGDELV